MEEQFQLQMQHDLINILHALFSGVEENSDTNQMINNFSEKKNNSVLGKYCTSKRIGKIAYTNLITDEDNEPWLNQNVKNLYYQNLTALENYNSKRNTKNYDIIMESKRKYKSLQRKLKNRYRRQQGDMVEQLKENKSKIYNILANEIHYLKVLVSLTQFFEHFWNLAQDSPASYISIINYIDTNCTVFDCLNMD